jgi:hypothetical protein
MSRVRIFVPAVPEFSAMVRAAKEMPACDVTAPLPGYEMIESGGPIEFRRSELGLKPAVWYGIFTGGFEGRIELFDRDRVRLVPE